MKKNIIIYTVAAIITSVFSFLSVTILSHMLSKSDFGIIENFTALSALVTALMMWGSSVPLVNYYSGKSHEQEFVMAFRGILLQSCLFFLFVPFCENIFFGLNRQIIVLIIIFSSISAFSTIFTTAFQLEKKSIKYAFFTSLIAFFSASLGVVWVYYTRSFYGRILAPTIIAFFGLFFLYYDFDKQKIITSSSFKKSIKDFYKIGFPLVVGLVLSWVLEKIDRIMISEMISIEDLGVYGVGYKFGMIILFIQSAISRTWLPFLIDNVNNKEYVKKTIFKLSIFLLVVTIIFSFVSFFYIQFFIDKKFVASCWIAVIVSFGYCFDGIWKLFNGILIFENRYKYYTMLVGIAGACNVVVNYFAIPKWGINGAAVATLIAFIAGMFFNWYYVKFKLNWFKVNNEK